MPPPDPRALLAANAHLKMRALEERMCRCRDLSCIETVHAEITRSDALSTAAEDCFHHTVKDSFFETIEEARNAMCLNGADLYAITDQMRAYAARHEQLVGTQALRLSARDQARAHRAVADFGWCAEHTVSGTGDRIPKLFSQWL